jgi:hypothetical protein
MSPGQPGSGSETLATPTVRSTISRSASAPTSVEETVVVRPSPWMRSCTSAETSATFWCRLTRDYLPEVAGLLADWPSLADLTSAIGGRAEPVLIPWDCTDGFFEAYWRRPEAYLEDHVRRAVSVWTRVGLQAEQRAVAHLRDDLISGRWADRNRDLLALDAAELGLRLLVA